MIREVVDATHSARRAFDEIIDVRSPAEFAADHIPGAINLPVLSDAERAEVGAIYVQTSKFLARRIGASYVSRNVADHLADHLSDRPAAYSPLIYCWRGGQRSAAMATVLSQVGWRVGLLRGGYKTYRRHVVDLLYDTERPLDLVLLCGPTGSGKTAVLELLARRGLQTLDLEALAAHRGSLFGQLAGIPQPTQKMFETRIVAALTGFDPALPIVVEAESSRVGELRVPARLWKAMRVAAGVELRTPLVARVQQIAATYGAMLAHPREVIARLERLPRHHSREQRDLWKASALAGDGETLARALLEAHYDPSYRQASAGHAGKILGQIDVADTSPRSLAAAADAILALIARRL